jgi:hypothetical protein
VANTSGSDNTGVGYLSLYSNTNGYDNTAIGVWALLGNTSGHDNTASGTFALQANTSGYYNVASGASALQANSTGFENTAVGFAALGNNTTDSGLVAVGYQALQNDASSGLFSVGGANSAVGYQALQSDSSGGDNTGFGYQSLLSNTAGGNNTALGALSLNNSTGSGNIGIGFLGGSGLTSGSYDIDIGNQGASGDNGIIRIGTPGTQTRTYLAGSVASDGGLTMDQSGTFGQNNGTVISNALTFGTGPGGSGEGIASQRTSGPNQFDLALYTGFNPRLTILSSGNVGIGTTNPAALLEVNGNATVAGALSGGLIIGGSIFTAGPVNCDSVTASGFILCSSIISGPNTCSTLTITGGSDLAEPFAISARDETVSEGDVVVIDDAHPGQLTLTDQPYDTRVAGVISGANCIHPGIQMHQQGLLEGGRNVALTCRVYVQADTSNGSIKPGDMLTTSTTPGVAMKVTDHARAGGAILGKAMSALTGGRGMVLVLVTLQ